MKERNKGNHWATMWSFNVVLHKDANIQSLLSSLITLSLDFNMLDYNSTLFYPKIVVAHFFFKEPTVNMEVDGIEGIFIRLSFRNNIIISTMNLLSLFFSLLADLFLPPKQ